MDYISITTIIDQICFTSSLRKNRCSLTSFTANICAKDKATVATRNMFPDEGRKCVCEVFDEAMKDFAPVVGDGKSNSSFLKAGCAKGNGPFSMHQNDYHTTSGPSFSSPRRSDR